MNDTQGREIEFALRGTVEPAGGGDASTRVRASALRAGGDVRSLRATTERDVVKLKIVNGPELVLHPETMRELLASQSGDRAPEEVATRGEGGQGPVEVPLRLAWGGGMLQASDATRSGLNPIEVLVETFEVVKGSAAKVSAQALRALIDSQVDSGLYELDARGLARLKGSPKKLDSGIELASRERDVLVLLHGTFSETAGTFGKLWSHHSSGVADLFTRFHGRVFGFDHRTLGDSPLVNALALAQALPSGAVLSLLSHSRGGLVAEALALACARDPREEELRPLSEEERNTLATLRGVVSAKALSVKRVVRVACPTRGTLLAGKRLDAYVSILKWALEFAAVPFLPALVEFLHAVAKQRESVDTFPGLAAMIPDSSLVKWLHAGEADIPGDLRVVAGDVAPESVWSWVKTLASDAFFWTDNDFVVQTRSMYGGALRKQGQARFFLDRGGSVSHFAYFSNPNTAGALLDALTQEDPKGFSIIGPRSYAGTDSSGTRALGAASTALESGERPALFLLPGILGSNLKYGFDRIWVSHRLFNNFDKLAYRPEHDVVEPDGCYDDYYAALIEYFSRHYDVVPFAFDWRKPLELEAERLEKALDEALRLRAQTGMPVRILAHSMGGLLARSVELVKPETWARFMAQPGVRFLMLGTPNEGSWKPMRVLTGDDAFGNTLAFVGSLFDGVRSRELMGEFPGFLQLQAGLLDGALGERAQWAALAKQDLEALRAQSLWHRWFTDVHDWGIPSERALAAAVSLRKALTQQRARFAAYGSKVLLVVGRDRWTPERFTKGPRGIEYIEAEYSGDGTVLHESARLQGVPTYELDANHGDLPRTSAAFDAYLELLEKGNVSDKAPVKPFGARLRAGLAAGEEPMRRRVRPARDAMLATAPEIDQTALLSAADAPTRELPAGAALPVSILNAHLKFVRQPLLLGHYRSLRLTGTERAMNALIGDSMAESLALGTYPEPIGTHAVFVNRRADPANPLKAPMPEAVIVVGLGEEGELDATELAKSVEKGVLAYARSLADRLEALPVTFELASTLVGSGGATVSVSTSALAVARGVRAANTSLALHGFPVVSRLTIVELFLDRAVEAYRALDALRTSSAGSVELDGQVARGAGGMLRPVEANYRGTGYDFVTVSAAAKGATTLLEYALDTRRARSELRSHPIQLGLVSELARGAGDHRNRNEALGRALFTLLVPVEVEPFLAGSEGLVLQLDRSTAKFPWEVLDTEAEGSRREPWAVRRKLIRKLRTREFRAQPVSARGDGGVLIIGAPLCPDNYGRLPAAIAEAKAVAAAFESSEYDGPIQPPLIERDGVTVLTTLLGAPFRVVHIAGHGAPFIAADPVKGVAERLGGVVLDGTKLLSAAEISSMRRVPELVFVNCCHLAELPDAPRPEDRAEFAAGVAEALIAIGVRCVIAAGWAVHDAPAQLFAGRFYERLLAGDSFGDAVAAAREETWKRFPHSNTWAAYQCYGDPDWRFRGDAGDQQPRRAIDIRSSVGLENALRALASDLKYHLAGIELEGARAELTHLAARYGTRWGTLGAVAEAFAEAYSEAKLLDRAIDWYERALAAPDRGATLRAVEQLANLTVRRAEGRVDAANQDGDLAAAAREARTEIARAMAVLEPERRLESRANKDFEALNLLGSAHKRLAMIARSTGEHAEFERQMAEMVRYYESAAEIAHRLERNDAYYPAMNALLGRLIPGFARAAPTHFPEALTAVISLSIKRALAEEPDFWPAISAIELEIYRALAARALRTALLPLTTALADLQRRAPAKRMWSSVLDQARLYLDLYASSPSTSEDEKRAAAELLAILAGLAGG